MCRFASNKKKKKKKGIKSKGSNVVYTQSLAVEMYKEKPVAQEQNLSEGMRKIKLVEYAPLPFIW